MFESHISVMVPLSFLQRERETERETYIPVVHPQPEGRGEHERGRGVDRRKERWECSILGNMRRAESSWTSSVSIVKEHKSEFG